MKALAYLKDPIHGCATVSELILLGKQDKAAFETLKRYAVEEMKNRSIPVDEETA